MNRLIIAFSIWVFTSGANAAPWVIGLDADLSSVSKAGGIAISQGANLAIAEINAKGGILGEQVVLKMKDHRGNPARGIANIKSLSKNDKLLAVIGGVHTPVALAELPLIHEKKVIYLDPWAAGTPVIRNGYQPNFAFRLSVRDEWAASAILNKAKSKGCQSVTLFLEQTGWGRSNEKSMTKASAALDLPIKGIEWFHWNSKILDKLVTKTVNDGTQCIALVANTPEGSQIINSIANIDKSKRPKVFSHWGIVGGDFTKKIELAQLAKVELYFLNTLAFNAPKTPTGVLLKKSFEKKHGKQPANEAFNGVAHAYDLVHLLALAVEKAGSAESTKVRSTLEKLGKFKGAMKTYIKPFSADQHEALDVSDYIMLEFNEQGFSEFSK